MIRSLRKLIAISLTTKEQYIRNQEIIRRRIEKAFIPSAYAAIKSQYQAAITVVKEKGVQYAQGNIHGDVINQEMGSVIEGLYEASAKLAIKKYKPNKKAFGYNEEFINQVIEYFRKFLLEKVVLPISKTTIDDIEKILQEALNEGWGVDRTVKELDSSEIPVWRAKLIVRTESARATNFTQMAAADQEDVEMEKQWIAIEDSRTRKSHSHAGVDGQRVDIDQPFSNGLMFPGDPNGPISQTANCRCTMGYFAKRDANGKIIPKQPNPLNLISRLNINRQAA